MLSFKEKWYLRFVVATVCVLSMSSGTPPADAQDGVVMISDNFDQSASSRKQSRRFDHRVRSAACDSGCCDVGCCDSGCCDGCCDDCCCGDCCCSPWWAHCSGVAGEFLYLHTTDADVAYAQQQNGIGGAGTVPFGRIGSLGPHHEPGVRGTVTKAFSECSSLVMSYTFFESDSIDGLVPPTVTGGGGAVGSLVHHPGAAITASIGPVSSAYDVDFQLADILYRSVWKATDFWAVNWSVGGLYGNLDQDFRMVGQFSGGTTGEIETRTNINFDGGGLKLGLDGVRRLGCGGWSIFSKGFVSTLSGRFHADYRLQNNTTTQLLALSDWEDDRIITILDLEGGLRWTGPCRKWSMSAGYMVSYWFNALTTSEFINTVQADSYVGADDTLKFEGLTAKIERRW